ncbi:MAG: alpha/beta hydrolase-fold protein [Pirellulaceae bacterium]
MQPSRALSAFFLLMVIAGSATAQEAVKAEKPRPKFRWVNPLPEGKTFPGLRHGVYHSKLMDREVGYCIYLPPGYDAEENAARRYPVVYYLHGGRPGGETKSIALSEDIDRTIRAGEVPPTIYVFVNGGHVSHYNYPKLDSPGETTFITELIPHVDAAYRTIASRAGRGLEGFSQGGRGTARHMCKYPELFCSAAPMGGGHQHEKRISENEGLEGEYRFAIGDNSYDLARRYAKKKGPKLNILVVVGTKDFNYEANLEYMEHLKSLGIDFQHIIVEDAPHSARIVYQKVGPRVMRFHAENFARAAKEDDK